MRSQRAIPPIQTSFRNLLFGLFMIVLAACAVPATPGQTTAQTSETSAAATETLTLRIGYQRGSEYWNLLKAQGTLEKRFGEGVVIEWSLFTSGPPMLEALNAGAIDIGQVGETPPIFAQAAGAPLLYVAQQAGTGAGSAVLSLPDSPVQTLADLKGKKVAFTKASSAHLLLIRSLEKAGLTYSDIEPAFLQPPEARAALEGGSVDAWVIWNPFMEAAVQEINAHIVVDGAEVSPTKSYIIAAKPFVDQHADEVDGIIQELQAAQKWAAANLDEYGAILEKETELAASVWTASYDREQSQILLIDEQTVIDQQAVADIFYNLELIPEPIKISDVAWFGK